METWHDDDRFWETMAPVMFGEQRSVSAVAEVDQVLALLGTQPGIAVLDLCCGPGRHSLELARRGFHVTGVDRTAAYLDRARQLASQEGLNVEFVQDDMRRFCPPDAFRQPSYSLFTSFGFFEDPAENQSVLCNLYRSLKGGGALIVDVMGKATVGPHLPRAGLGRAGGVSIPAGAQGQPQLELDGEPLDHDPGPGSARVEGQPLCLFGYRARGPCSGQVALAL